MRDVLANKPRIKLLACDVDGVLTDGGMYFGVEGQIMKRFNVKDGLGMTLLRDSGVRMAFVSADQSVICRVRGEKLGVHDICFGVSDKAAALQDRAVHRAGRRRAGSARGGRPCHAGWRRPRGHSRDL